MPGRFGGCLNALTKFGQIKRAAFGPPVFRFLIGAARSLSGVIHLIGEFVEGFAHILCGFLHFGFLALFDGGIEAKASEYEYSGAENGVR